MALRIDIDTSGLKINAVRERLHSDKLGIFAATEWHRLYKRYVPEDSGTMYNSVSIEPWQITHTAPYSHYQYEGRTMGRNVPINNGESWYSANKPKYYTGSSLHYRKAGATSHWDEAAQATELPKLAKAIAAFITMEDK